jgi:E3 ubiquitin-protein ligase UBR1
VVFYNDSLLVFMPPPYMDAHGEVDVGLRRGRPLFLNTMRYDELRKMWLTNMIPSYIARKMEAIIDAGGWNTM